MGFELSKEQIAKYVEDGGTNCPVCGSGDLYGMTVEIDASIAWQNLDCHGCGASWTDQYSLTGIDNLEVKSNTSLGEEGQEEQ